MKDDMDEIIRILIERAEAEQREAGMSLWAQGINVVEWLKKQMSQKE